MKKIFFTLLTLGLLYNSAQAQYCYGNPSGTAVCDTIPLASQGFSPTTDSLPPMINGEVSSTIIYFRNYAAAPPLQTFTSLRVDSIGNLPPGICWSTNSPNNTFGNSRSGCFKLTGTACGATGQYKLVVKATINGVIPVDLETSQGLRYYIRLNNAGDTVTPVDTAETALLHPYGAGPTGCTPNAVNEVENSSITSLMVYPNPVNNHAEVKFVSTKSGEVTERITNILGREVVRNIRTVRPGTNTFGIDRGNLAAGVYFYSLTEGRNVVTKRLIISE